LLNIFMLDVNKCLVLKQYSVTERLNNIQKESEEVKC
jgi:hypothetical protein